MSFALVTNTSVVGHRDITSPAIDTTGTNLIVVSDSRYQEEYALLSDSKSNTWTALTLRASGSVKCRLYYCLNPTVGSGHTFSADSDYHVISVLAFSGAHATSSFENENGAGAASGTSLQTGSLTPAENNELLVAAVSGVDSSPSEAINLGFTLEEFNDYGGGSNMMGGLAYQIQTTATARNPAWSGTDMERAAAIATFKAAAAAGPAFPVLLNQIRQRWA
jgi:hypothetical protein